MEDEIEEQIEYIIQLGIKAYKKRSRGSVNADRLYRHKTILIDGYEFNTWREYTMYKMALYLRTLSPNISLYLELDGNETELKVVGKDKELVELSEKLNGLIDQTDKYIKWM